MPLLNQTRLDYVVIGFALGVAVLASVIFGTMPAWQASSIGDVVARIREEGGSTTSDPKRQRTAQPADRRRDHGRRRVARRRGPAGAQLRAIAVGRPGLQSQRRADVQHRVPEARYAQPHQRDAFVTSLLSRAATQSERRVRRRDLRPAADRISGSAFRRRHRDGVTLSDDEQDRLTLQVRVVTPDYFKTMGIPVIKGRGFTAGDRIGSQPVAMLNETARGSASGRIRMRSAITCRLARGWAWAAIAPAAR